MVGLAAARAALVEQLADLDDVTTSPCVIAQITPPMVMVDPADPYVEDGDTFDTAQMFVRLNAYLLVDPAENDTETDALDALIEAVLVRTPDWDLVRVSKPFIAALAGGRYLACRLTVKTPFTLTPSTEQDTPA